MVWPYHEERGRVNAQSYDAVKGEWKEIKRRPRLTWLDNIDRHQKGKNTFLKKVLRTKCFENGQNWRTLIFRSTDRNSGEYPWAPPWSVVSIILLSCRSWFSARCWDAIVHFITTRMALQQVYWNQRQVAVSWTGSFIHATVSPPPRKSTVAYFAPIH